MLLTTDAAVKDYSSTNITCDQLHTVLRRDPKLEFVADEQGRFSSDNIELVNHFRRE